MASRLGDFKIAKLNSSSNKPAILPGRCVTRAYFERCRLDNYHGSPLLKISTGPETTIALPRERPTSHNDPELDSRLPGSQDGHACCRKGMCKVPTHGRSVARGSR